LNSGAQFNLLQGNWIGTNRALEPDLGNRDAGVMINLANNNLIGGLLPGEGNVIVGDRLPGVRSANGNGNEISANSIFDNGYAGIDIGEFLISPNDALDPDDVGNRKQNYPLLFSASVDAGGTEVEVRLQNEPNTQYRIEFFNSAECHASGFGEGNLFIGRRTVTTDEQGEAVAFYTFNQVTLLPFLTATVTDGEGNTSEFSPCLEIGGNPAGQIQFFHDSVLAYEGVFPAARVILTRSHGFTGTVSAEFTVSNDTALAGQDYIGADQIVSFAEAESIKVIEIPLLVDPAIEASPEKAQLALAPATGGAELGMAASELFIFDENQGAPGLIIDDTVMTEGQSGIRMMRFDVSLSASERAFSLDFRTLDGSASAGEDYIANQGTLNFEASAVQQQR
ncbi:MAG: Calx-beta domain-containing protein, partial [Pseudomonadota bacterium]